MRKLILPFALAIAILAAPQIWAAGVYTVPYVDGDFTKNLDYYLPRTFVKFKGKLDVYKIEITKATKITETRYFAAISPTSVNFETIGDENLKFAVDFSRLRGFATKSNMKLGFNNHCIGSVNATLTNRTAAITEDLVQTAVNIAEMVMAAAGPDTYKLTKLDTVPFETGPIDPTANLKTPDPAKPTIWSTEVPDDLTTANNAATGIVMADNAGIMPNFSKASLRWTFSTTVDPSKVTVYDSKTLFANYLKTLSDKEKKRQKGSIDGLLYRSPRPLEIKLVAVGAHSTVVYDDASQIPQLGPVKVMPISSQVFLDKTETASFAKDTGELSSFGLQSDSRGEEIAGMLKDTTNVLGQLFKQIPVGK